MRAFTRYKDYLKQTSIAAMTGSSRALITFLAFVSFGVIPLLPYLVSSPHAGQTFAATVATGVALVLLGLLRHVTTRAGIIRAVGVLVAAWVKPWSLPIFFARTSRNGHTQYTNVYHPFPPRMK